jgi:hypothetical protein
MLMTLLLCLVKKQNIYLYSQPDEYLEDSTHEKNCVKKISSNCLFNRAGSFWDSVRCQMTRIRGRDTPEIGGGGYLAVVKHDTRTETETDPAATPPTLPGDDLHVLVNVR